MTTSWRTRRFRHGRDQWSGSSVDQGAAGLRLKDLAEGMGERTLVGFDGEEIVAAGSEDLLTEGALTEQGITGQHPAVESPSVQSAVAPQ